MSPALVTLNNHCYCFIYRKWQLIRGACSKVHHSTGGSWEQLLVDLNGVELTQRSRWEARASNSDGQLLVLRSKKIFFFPVCYFLG